MQQTLVSLALVLAVLQARGGPPADPVVGNWRGTLKAAQGVETPIIITIAKKGAGYDGSTNGLNAASEIPFTRIAVTGNTATLDAESESRLGDVALAVTLTMEGNAARGTGTLSVGAQKFDVTLALQRRARGEVIQPTVDQRIDYFVGRWKFEYVGGEFPPLSAGSRAGTMTFAKVGSSHFVAGQLEGDVAGKAYQEKWSLGLDPDTKMLVVQERRGDGTELVSVANWRSPIAISFVTAPVQAGGKTYQLRRLLSVTSETAFDVTEEFSVDGGPFRRLGNGHFTRTQ